MDDLKHGIGLWKENLVQATMVMGLPLIGAGAVILLFSLITLPGIGYGLSGLFMLLCIIAGPALFYFMAQAHVAGDDHPPDHLHARL